MQETGFLGTAAPWAADLTLVLELAMGTGLLAGALLARAGRIRLHASVPIGHRPPQSSLDRLDDVAYSSSPGTPQTSRQDWKTLLRARCSACDAGGRC